MTERVEMKGMVPENHVPNRENSYYLYDKVLEKFIQLGECTGDAIANYSQEGGPEGVPVWTFKFYSSMTKSSFSNYLKNGNIYYKVSSSK